MSEINHLRIDKWLWAARFYKTRQLAVKALKNGQVSLGKQSIKPASSIKAGDEVKIKRGHYICIVIIDRLLDKRGSAVVAQTMYHETDKSIADREALKNQIANQPKIDIDRRKPEKRAVRSQRSFKRGE